MLSRREKRAKKKRKDLPVRRREEDDETVAIEEEAEDTAATTDVGNGAVAMEIERSESLRLRGKKRKKKKDRETDGDEIIESVARSPAKRFKSEDVVVDEAGGTERRKHKGKKLRSSAAVVEEMQSPSRISDSDDDDEVELVVEEKKKKTKKAPKAEDDPGLYNWTGDQDLQLLQFLISQCDSHPKEKHYNLYDWSEFKLDGISQAQALKRADHIRGHIRMTKTQLQILNEAKEMLAADPNAFSYRGGKRLGKRRVKRLYDEPSQPPSAYMLFSQIEGPKLREQYPKETLQFYGRTLGEMWRSLEPRKKTKYVQKADEARQKYKEEHEEFLARHPDLRDKKTSRAPLLPHDAPMKPRTAFFFFCDNYRSQIAEGTRKEKQKQLLQDFKIASKEEQGVFQQKAAQDKLRFAKELEEYIERNPDQAILLERMKGAKKKPTFDPPSFTAPPKNLYLFFCQRQRKKFLSELPPGQKADFATLSKQFAVEWKELEQSAKEKLAHKLNKAEKKYQQCLDEYLESLSEQDRIAFLNSMRKKKAKPTYVRGHPDISLDGYKMFARSKRIELKGLDPLAKPSKINKDLTDIWVGLPKSERVKWKGIEEASTTKQSPILSTETSDSDKQDKEKQSEDNSSSADESKSDDTDNSDKEDSSSDDSDLV